MPPPSSTKLPTPERALSAILPLIDTAPYEAHQKARTFASRYLKSAPSSSSPNAYYDTTITILFQSACALLKIGQTGSGVDLTSFLLDVYELKGQEINDESRGRLTQIIALTGDKGVWRKDVISKCVAWTAKNGVYPAGDPALHYYVGDLLYKEDQYDIALPHFLNSGNRDSARSLAEMFIVWLSSTPPAYQGIFALHGVLPYLVNGNILAAKTFITHFVSKLTLSSSSKLSSHTAEVTLTPDPLVNFAQLAVETCQRGQGEKTGKVMKESWGRLCAIYASGGSGRVLDVPEVKSMVQELSSLYFGISPPRAQAANPMADMMSSLFGGGSGGGGSEKKRGIVRPISRPLIGGGEDMD